MSALDRWQRLHLDPDRVGDMVLAVGEAVALVVGSVGVVAAIPGRSATGGIEDGPPTILTIVAVRPCTDGVG